MMNRFMEIKVAKPHATLAKVAPPSGKVARADATFKPMMDMEKLAKVAWLHGFWTPHGGRRK
jgi:hypothetical protein